MEEMNELKNMAPKLSKIKKENPYRAPDKYFDDFSARLQMRLEAEKQPLPDKQNKVIRLLKPVIGLAASFALIFMLVYWPLSNFMNKEVAQNTEVEEIVISDDVYSTLVEGIDESTFYALLEQQETTEQISDEEMFDYLSDNVSDYEIYLETDYK